MRPRKIVMLVDTNPINLSIRSFIIDVWGYRPIKARSAVEAMRLLQDHKAYTMRLILVGDGIGSKDILRIAHRALDTSQLCPIYEAENNMLPQELRAGIKEKTSRKRGPREKSKNMLEMERAA